MVSRLVILSIKVKAPGILKLEKYGSDNNNLFIKNGDTIETAFNDAKTKIEELKKSEFLPPLVFL